jgi:putative flippase GtrA
VGQQLTRGKTRSALASSSIRQLILYGIVGVGSNLALYVFYLVITSFHVVPWKAMSISYLIGSLIGFVANRQWTFSYRGSLPSTLLRYAAAHMCGYLINLMMIRIFVDKFGFAHQLVQAAAIVVVATFLFLTFKYLVFPAHKSKA